MALEDYRMALIGQLYSYGRSAERHDLAADATVRGPDRVPVDVLVVDLSQTGCLFVSSEAIAVGSVVTIGIAGVGLREALVVRNQDIRFGCTFSVPLTKEELTAGLAESETVAVFPSPQQLAANLDAVESMPKLPRPARLAAVLVLVATSWTLMTLLMRLILHG